MNSILVEIKYNGAHFMFRCACFDKSPKGNWRAWLGDRKKYHTVVEFKRGVEFIDVISCDLPSETKEDFDSEIAEAIKEIW